MSDTIIIGIIPSLGGPQDPPIVGDWGNQGPHHAPANISLPTVVYDAGTLLYIGTGNASFTYSVVDESEEVWQTGEITLSSGQETSALRTLVIEEMQGAYTMSVPLLADCGEGKNWLEAH